MLITNTEYDRHFLSLAYEFAKKNSPDPRTKNAALIVNPKSKEIISKGANRFPEGVIALPERLHSDQKRNYLEHAERDAIFSALRNGQQTKGAIMYVPWFACSDCAKAIIGAGIVCVVGHKQPCATIGAWTDSINVGLQLFKEAKVSYRYFEGKIGVSDVIFNGEFFSLV